MPTTLVDWDLIRANIGEIDDEQTDALYSELLGIKAEEINDLEKLGSAFKAAQCVMQRKSAEAEAALDELEAYVSQYDPNEIESIKKELELYKATAKSGGLEETLQQVREYESMLEESQEALERQTSELNKAKKRIADLEKKLQLNEKEIQSLQDEIDSLKEEVESSRHGLQDSISDSQEPLEKLREKNKQIQNLLDELNQMETVNIDLAHQVKWLKEQLESATSDIKSAGDEMAKMRDQILQVQETNAMLLKDKEFMLKENDSLRTQLNEHQSNESSTLEKYDQKMKELSETIANQNDQLEQLRNQIKCSEEDCLNGSVPAIDKHWELIKELQLKEAQIDYLKGQMDEAVREIETQNQIIEKMIQNDTQTQPTTDTDRLSSGELIFLKGQVNHLREKVDRLEEELKSKDEELHQAIMIKRAYEHGEYGLPQALGEIRNLKKLITQKDSRIEELINELNQMNDKLELCQENLEDMKAIRNLVKDPFNLPKYDGTSKDETESTPYNHEIREKLKILRLQQTLVKLEDEKIALTEELRQKRLSPLFSSNKSGKPESDSLLKTEAEEDNKQMIQHMKEVEEENKQLQIGMKEILIALRESDSQSDIMIDCPSLERLVQLLESRSLNHDLTCVIALKAELDLLRGHNQQLRMELKLLRQQNLKLIFDFSDEVLKRNNTQNHHSDANDSADTLQTVNNGNSDEQESGSSDSGNNKNELSHDIKATSTDLDSLEEQESETGSNVHYSSRNSEQRVAKTETDNEDSPGVVPESELKIDSFDCENIERRSKPENCSGDEKEINNEESQIFESPREKTIDSDQSFVGSDQGKTSIPKPAPRRSLVFKSVSLQTCIDSEALENFKCERCNKLLEYVLEIKSHLQKLAESIKISESSYLEQIDCLKTKNEQLQRKLDNLEAENGENAQVLKNEMPNIMNTLKIYERPADACLVDHNNEPFANTRDLKANEYESFERGLPVHMRKAMVKVLETVLTCLHKRIEQKDSAIKEYEKLITKFHKNHEIEMSKLVELRII